jgi:pyridoxal phosphate enzyme (YggS family)
MKEFTGTAEHVRERFAEVREKVAAAAAAAGRSGDDVEILVATKYVPADKMAVLRDAGVRLVGENRAQDLVEKHALFGGDFDFDFIGELQSRKAKLVMPRVRLIHSIDSLSAVAELNKRAGRSVPVLLEVNVDEEETKGGVAPDVVDTFLDEAARCELVEFVGLMCMPPLFPDPEQARSSFARTRELAQRLSDAWRGRYTFARLSMGTSADYEVAVQEGATIVRVGSVLF